MDYLKCLCFETFECTLLSMGVKKLLDHILICVLKMNESLTVVEGEIDERIFIF